MQFRSLSIGVPALPSPIPWFAEHQAHPFVPLKDMKAAARRLDHAAGCRGPQAGAGRNMDATGWRTEADLAKAIAAEFISNWVATVRVSERTRDSAQATAEVAVRVAIDTLGLTLRAFTLGT